MCATRSVPYKQSIRIYVHIKIYIPICNHHERSLNIFERRQFVSDIKFDEADCVVIRYTHTIFLYLLFSGMKQFFFKLIFCDDMQIFEHDVLMLTSKIQKANGLGV